MNRLLTGTNVNRIASIAFAAICALLGLHGTVSAVDVEGFTEPNRTIEVAAQDDGILAEVLVNVGDYVKEGQLIARLDDKMERVILLGAKERKEARGRYLSAKAEISLRTDRLEKLQQLRGEGFGRREEVMRAATDLEIAKADLQAVADDLKDREAEYQKAKVSLERRSIVAPISGFVAERKKHQGEYVSASDPNIVTLVNTDEILARVSMRQADVRRMQLGQKVSVRVPFVGKPVVGIVDEISPIVDAQSGTTRVRIRVPNPKNAIMAGQHCTVSIDTTLKLNPTKLDEKEGPQPRNAMQLDASLRSASLRSASPRSARRVNPAPSNNFGAKPLQGPTIETGGWYQRR